MTIDHFDDSTRPTRPRLIPGVYRYCDSWCERCRFQQRCRVFRDHQRIEAALASGKSIEEALRSSNEEEDEDSDMIPPMKASERLERESFLKALDEALSREPTPEELRNRLGSSS